MLKRRSKAISIVVALMFCLSFMVPAFVTPDAAQASSTYEVLAAPTVTTAVTTQNLGVVKVTLADAQLCAYDRLTVSLPSDLTFPKNSGVVAVSNAAPSPIDSDAGITIVAPGASFDPDALGTAAFTADPYSIRSNEFDIVMASDLSSYAGKDKYFYIYFNGINLNNTTGDITVDFRAPSGSGFSSANGIVIAKSSSEGSTTTTIKKVKNITDKANQIIDPIIVEEDAPGSLDFAKSGIFKLEILTRGYEWEGSTNGEITFGWSLSGLNTNANATVKGEVTGNNKEYVEFDLGDETKGAIKEGIDAGLLTLTNGKVKTKSPARISFDNLKIVVDDNKATTGEEVEVKVKGYDMDKATIVVAKYSDYDTKVAEGTTKTLVAGQKDQEIGEFYIEEGAAGSLLDQRVIKFTLPTGVEWYKEGEKEVVSSGGSIGLSHVAITGDNDEINKWEINNPSTNDPVKIKFKDMKVNIAPDFRGDLVVKVDGSAGVQGEVKVAEVKPIATIETDKVVNVILGKANQKIGDITLVEGDVEGFLDTTKEDGALIENANKILLDLDEGYRFAKLPNVKVAEGDIDIDEEGIALNKSDNRLEIEVKSQSKKTPAKIEISDIYVDAYRTAPEGAVSIKFAKGRSALNETRWDTKSPGKAVIANCVTAAMGETIGNGQFVIDSNIYEVNGVKKVMDAAPYIKGDRTYVPVRYLGYVLGLTDDDIVWDESSQKVTFTKGDTTVELVIGSTTITVNGEEQVMDVAPEISNDRTMLPARYVAEGFGFNVGWDAASRIVLISK